MMPLMVSKLKLGDVRRKVGSVLHFPFSIFQPPSIFLRDRRGASLVTYALVLPLLIMLIFGAATVWRVISVKQSMDLATYEAVRFLSQEGRDLGLSPALYYDPELWRKEAYELVEPWMQGQIRRNSFVDEEDTLEVEIVPPIELDCSRWARTDHERPLENVRFRVTTRLTLKTPIQIPYMSAWAFTFEERHGDIVECPRYFRDPPDEGDVF